MIKYLSKTTNAMKPPEKPTRANSFQSAFKSAIRRQSHQTLAVIQRSESMIKSIDWMAMIKTGCKITGTALIITFSFIKSIVTPIWLAAKSRFIEFTAPYYEKVADRLQQWTNLFYNEMDEITLMDDGGMDHNPAAKQTLSGISTGFPGGHKIEQSYYQLQLTGLTALNDIKKYILSRFEKVAIMIETFVGRAQTNEFSQVAFEVVNIDEHLLIRVNKRVRVSGSLVAQYSSNENPDFQTIVAINQALYWIVSEKMKNDFFGMKKIAINLVVNFLQKLPKVLIKNMFSPSINAGYSFMASNPGYP